MLLELKRRSQNESLVQRIDGYTGDVSKLGPVIRHVITCTPPFDSGLHLRAITITTNAIEIPLLTWLLVLNFLQDDFVVWKGQGQGKGKLRHLILFEDELLITRRKEPIRSSDLPRYDVIDIIKVRISIIVHTRLGFH